MENELDYQKLPHLLRGEVTVGPRSVPIAVNGLGVECDNNSTSATLSRMYLAIQRSSPMWIPSVGPTWNSHWAGIT